MVFDLTGKVAIVTGGASGIGLYYVKELLRNGVQGVTLADISSTKGDEAIKEIEKEFGINKAIFVQTNITDKNQFENAFQKTVEKFKHLDILINNAGILNDAVWKQEIEINLIGTINGILLAIENYFPKYKQGSEGVIVNASSIASVDPYPNMPIYCATKAAIVHLTRSWGTPHLYERLGVRFISISPGATETPLLFDIANRNLGPIYEEYIEMNKHIWITQPPEHVGKELINLIKYADNGSMWIVDENEPAYQYIPADRLEQKKNVLKIE